MGLGILCPGQGSQQPGMLDILAGNVSAESVLAEAATLLGRDVGDLARDPVESHRNRVAQPLICASELATWLAIREELPVPVAFAGYSVGELAAYGCAGALTPADLTTLAFQRAKLMDAGATSSGKLVAVRGLARRQLQSLCRRFDAELAIINGYDHFVVGLADASINAFGAAAADSGAITRVLPVEVAAHTRWMESAGRAFRDLLEGAEFADPDVPVLSGMDGSPITTRADAIDALSRQISNCIDWSRCLEMLIELGCSVLLELGPGTTLTRMVREAFPDFPVRSVADFRSLPAVPTWVHKAMHRAGTGR